MSDAPTIRQLQARTEAELELPRLSLAAALHAIRTRSRSEWIKEAIDTSACTAELAGVHLMASDLDRHWPVLAVTFTRKAAPGKSERAAALLITKTQPGKWTIIERAAMPVWFSDSVENCR